MEGLRLSVNGQLILQVVEDVVGWGGQAARVGKGQVGSDEEVGQVISGDIAGDRLVVAGRAGVVENGFVVARVDPDGLEGGGRRLVLVVPRYAMCVLVSVLWVIRARSK